MHSALGIGADELDLYSTYERVVEIERIFDRKEARKRKLYFYCVVNKLVYVTPTARGNCALISLDLSLLNACLRGTFYAVLREEMEIFT